MSNSQFLNVASSGANTLTAGNPCPSMNPNQANSSGQAAAPASKLPKYVEQASTARKPVYSRRRSRSPLENQLPGSGEDARGLLGDEHGSAWDMVGWANDVLGKNMDTAGGSLGGSGSPLPSPPGYFPSRAASNAVRCVHPMIATQSPNTAVAVYNQREKCQFFRVFRTGVSCITFPVALIHPILAPPLLVAAAAAAAVVVVVVVVAVVVLLLPLLWGTSFRRDIKQQLCTGVAEGGAGCTKNDQKKLSPPLVVLSCNLVCALI